MCSKPPRPELCAPPYLGCVKPRTLYSKLLLGMPGSSALLRAVAGASTRVEDTADSETKEVVNVYCIK